MRSIVQCPVCSHPLHRVENKWACDNRHHFDLAKQGYCNLLLANQKKSAAPGDDRQMLLARSEFLKAGFYQPVSEAINNLIIRNTTDLRQILDLGCGEGYYLASLKDSLNNLECQHYGTDISKEALKLAARQHKSINWFVAAAKKQPFTDHQLDLILNIFAPADWHEIYRILKPGAYVLLAVAGENHLQTLREMIYNQVQAHQPDRFLDKIGADFELISSHDCQFELHLDDNQSIKSLLQMTPFYWQADEKHRQSIENLQSLTTPVNVRLYLLKARKII
ncbi:MAG: methyltransferase domain-containing protein [Gammaproteobacteria bacterium]|nr:methyltransferase domain-containing protein [Gammaproteobacteria bacterium]